MTREEIEINFPCLTLEDDVPKQINMGSLQQKKTTVDLLTEAFKILENQNN